MCTSLAAVALGALVQAGGPTIANTTVESFETGFGPWEVKHYLKPPAGPLEFSVTRSQAQARTGAWSLDFTALGNFDDGTVWIERTLDLPAGTHEIDLSFWLWSDQQGQVGTWDVVAFIGTSPPETEIDFTLVGQTAAVAGWGPYSLTRTVELPASGRVWVALGYSITFEMLATHYFDDVSVTVKPGCEANCDGSTTSPVLNINDFVCFQGRFAAGDPRANCDGSTTPPVLNVNDFVCFAQRFAAGCG